MAIDTEFIARIDSPRFCERLFAVLPDVVFCLKDSDFRYRAANQAFAVRLGLKDPRGLIGKPRRTYSTRYWPQVTANRICRSSRAEKLTTNWN